MENLNRRDSLTDILYNLNENIDNNITIVENSDNEDVINKCDRDLNVAKTNLHNEQQIIEGVTTTESTDNLKNIKTNEAFMKIVSSGRGNSNTTSEIIDESVITQYLEISNDDVCNFITYRVSYFSMYTMRSTFLFFNLKKNLHVLRVEHINFLPNIKQKI